MNHELGMTGNKPIKLAESLNQLMEAKNVSITTVAVKIRMNKSTLHNYCNGVVPRNLLNLKNLAEYFGVSLSELIFGLGQRELKRPEGFEGRYEIVIRHLDERS